MTLGLGDDLIDVQRIEKTLERFGDRFIQRVFTEVEQQRRERRVMVRAASYPKRFGAKEAFSKAPGKGFRQAGCLAGYWGRQFAFRAAYPTSDGGAASPPRRLVPIGYETCIDLMLTDDFLMAQAGVVVSGPRQDGDARG